jgi:hypothetical protein
MNNFLNSFFLLDVSLSPLQWRFSKWLKYLLLAALIFFAVVLPSFGQASSILSGQIDQMQNTQAWWDELWQKTYTPQGGTFGPGTSGLSASDYLMSSVVAWIFRIAVLYFTFRFVLKSAELVNGNISTAAVVLAPMFVSFFTAVVLLSNQGAMVRHIPVVMRNITNNWRNGLMEARIIDLAPREALNDIFATKESSNKIYLQLNECAKMPQPAVALPSPEEPTDPKVIAKLTPSQQQGYAYLRCLKKLEQVAEEVQSTCPIINIGNCGAFFRQFLNRTVKTVKGAVGQLISDLTKGKILTAQNPLLNMGAGFARNELMKPLFSAVQWAFINALELALWVDGLIAPIAIAVMLVPGRLNLFVAWFISMFTICLAQLVYTLIAGINALLIAQTNYDPGDLNFEMAIGVFAPLMSVAILGGGGIAATQSFVGQSVAVGSAVATGVSAAVSGGLSKFAAMRKW